MRNPFKQKTNKADYTASMLPHNRKQVFFDVIKLQWASFMRYGMLVLLFSIPMLSFAWIEDSYKYQIMKDISSLGEQERQAALNELLSMSNTRALLDIISFFLLSICMAGLVRIIRQCAWGENVSFATEFFTGIKQNAAQMLPLGIIVGVVNALSVYTYNLSVVMSEGLMSAVLIIPASLAVLIGIPVAAYSVVCISIYNNGLFGNMKMAFLVFAKTPFKSFLALLCCFLPFAMQLIPNMYFHIFGGIVGCIVSPFIMLAFFLFASDRLDEYINKEHFPSLVGRGTFPAEDENSQNSQ